MISTVITNLFGLTGDPLSVALCILVVNFFLTITLIFWRLTR